MLRWALPLLAIACGEVHFVDPAPPQLYRSLAQYTPATIAEPLVFVILLDLFVEDAAACAWARQTTLAAVRDAVAAVGGTQLELPAQDLSPDCRVRGRQPIDVEAIRSAVAAAQAALPGAHVRPAIFYVDNIDLVLPQELSFALTSLRTASASSGILWPISLPSVAKQLNAERTTEWTYAGDPDLGNRLRSSLVLYFPLQTSAALSSGPVPLLDAAHLETTEEFKVCEVPKDASIEDPPDLGTAALVDRARPPTITYDLDQSVALPKYLFPAPTLIVLIEGCTANCDRYWIRTPGDAPRRWDMLHGCVLGTP